MSAPAALETVTIRLGAATSLAELCAWFDAADVGERALYASGYALPREHESVVRVREWEAKGWVYLTQRRDPANQSLWLFEVHKGAAGSAAGADVGGKSDGAINLIEMQARSLLKRLRACAAAGEVCPSYSEMARFLALRPDQAGRRRARYALECLERQRRIAIEPGSAKRAKVVTILAPGAAKGKATARAALKPAADPCASPLKTAE